MQEQNKQSQQQSKGPDVSVTICIFIFSKLSMTGLGMPSQETSSEWCYSDLAASTCSAPCAY